MEGCKAAFRSLDRIDRIYGAREADNPVNAVKPVARGSTNHDFAEPAENMPEKRPFRRKISQSASRRAIIAELFFAQTRFWVNEAVFGGL